LHAAPPSLLGVAFDRKMSTAPHMDNMAKFARQRAALIARLTNHVPKGRFLRQLACGLVHGKVGHALAAVAAQRLLADTPLNSKLRVVQISLNDTARSVTGSKRSDHITVRDLNAAAKFPTLNEMVTRAVAAEMWVAYKSDDELGGRNPLGLAMFESSEYNRDTRAAAAGMVKNPMAGYDTLVSSGVELWNASPDLRTATTKREAKRAAYSFARGVPL
jgi:hypothetical protein